MSDLILWANLFKKSIHALFFPHLGSVSPPPSRPPSCPVLKYEIRRTQFCHHSKYMSWKISVFQTSANGFLGRKNTFDCQVMKEDQHGWRWRVWVWLEHLLEWLLGAALFGRAIFVLKIQICYCKLVFKSNKMFKPCLNLPSKVNPKIARIFDSAERNRGDCWRVLWHSKRGV